MQRIKQLINTLKSVDACVIDNPVDLLYLTGLSLSRGRLWVSKKETTLFVDGRYFAVAQKKAPCTVKIWEEQKNQKDRKVAFDSAFVSYNDLLSLQKAFPAIEWVPIAFATKQLRVCKDAKEIAALKKAAQVTWAGIQRVKQCLRVGVSEEELALEFEIFCRKQGASGLSFDSIIAFGENSAYPHHRAGQARLQKDQIVLIDVGAIVDQYHGDMTRIVYFGQPDPRLVKMEQIVRRAQKKAIEQIKPGISIGTLDQVVRDEFDKHNVKPLYIHNLGHGIGLETHEFPRIRFDSDDGKLILKQGMVFTVEPGLYQPGVGGIRWEDMVLVTENGYEILSDFSEKPLPLNWENDFPAIVSHEIRSPLTILKGYAETLSETDIAKKILAGCERLENLLNSLLTLSDLEQHQPKQMDLVALVENCKKNVLMIHPNAQIQIKSESKKVSIVADPPLLEIAIRNLLENGIKYSNPPARIEIEIRELDKEVALSVTDHGIGIPENELISIFDRFYAVDKAQSRKMGGAGLGLSIVQAIISLHQGRVEVVSEKGKGSTFTIFVSKRSSAK